MVELNKSFSINDVIVDRNSQDKDFAIVELWALAAGGNSHGNPISVDVLERDADTFKGKFIVGQLDKWTGDVKGHEVKEDIYGYVSVTEEPQFKKKIVDGVEKEFVVVQAVLSKIYAKDIVDLFRVNSAKSVSCEFSCSLQYDEDEYGRPIDEYGTPMDCDNPILGYSISGITILGKKIRPSVKGAEIIMKRFSEDTNKLETTSKEEFMEENKEFSEQPKDEDIVMEEKEPNQQEIDDTEVIKGDDEVDEIKGDKKEMSEENSESEEVKEMSEEQSQEIQEEVKEMSCASEEVKEESCGEEDKELSCEGNKELSEDSSEDEPNNAEEEKSFSEQAVEFADESHKDFIAKLFSSELNDMVSEIISLKQFMEDTIKEKTERKFSEIMVEPKLCLGEKAYNVLFEEGSQLSFSELDAFEQKVKAFCEDAPKKPQADETEVLTFSCGGNIDNNINTELSVEELIQKYNN